MDRIENSVHLGYLHRPTCTLFFVCFNYFSVSRLFPLPIASIVQT